MIQVDEFKNRFLVQTKTSTYAFQVNDAGYLTHLHWGGKIERIEDLPSPSEVTCYRHCPTDRAELNRQEYPAWGGEYFSEPALKADFPDDVRCSLLAFQSHKVKTTEDSEELIIGLRDTCYPLDVLLHYRIYSDSDVIERWSEIVNRGEGTVVLQNALSATFNLPRIDIDYRLTHLAGRWGKESTIERQMVNQSKILLESRTGISGPFAMPFFALDDGHSTEFVGRVYFGTLLYNGNWKIAVERDGYEQVSISGGINDFDFSWPLHPNETFVTPIFCVGITDEGFGGASRVLHSHQRLHLAPKAQSCRSMPLLFNSWASMGIDVNETKILTIAQKAAQIGAELFVIDDGWQTALGDWTPDVKKFPNGLKPIIDQVKALGMDFGLWVEVESFETASELYLQHPEWALSFTKRNPQYKFRTDINRTSLMLNFAREDVATHIYTVLKQLLNETGISYLKLDMNSFVTSPGWESVPKAEQSTVWVKYARNLQKIFIQLQQDFPSLLIENCASGAGRADLSMDRCFGRINRSDNQDALDILRLHEGFTWMHPTRMAGGGGHIGDGSHEINLRKTPLKFQAYVGMMGSLSVGKNLVACFEDELTEIRGYVDLYKQLRHIPQFGELYRLASHYDHPYMAFEFVSADKKEALVVILGHAIQFANRVPSFRLHGLIPDMAYQIECLGNNPQPSDHIKDKTYQPMSGRGLQELGVRVELLGDYDAKLLYLKAIH
jgi:alpha-galactosidase